MKDSIGMKCKNCGKIIDELDESVREGIIKSYFFGLFERKIWKKHFCSEVCDLKYAKAMQEVENG